MSSWDPHKTASPKDRMLLNPITVTTIFLFIFIILSFASALTGTWQYPLHILSFLLPILLYLAGARRLGMPLPARPTVAGWRRVLPLLPIFLATVMLTATLSSAIMQALGVPPVGGTAEGNGFLPDILTDCLLPALLEEGFMRMVILFPLLCWSPRHGTWLSALLFALMHMRLYQMPYAFVGGLFLALAVLWGDSPFYAIVFHFLNNLLSLFLQYAAIWWGTEINLYLTLGIGFCLFVLAGWGVYILVCRKKEKDGAKESPAPTDWRALRFVPFWLFVALMLGMTALTLLS